ncbi:hypothetical protein GF415_00450 [Candidatus Micrarchaeota archaeon]|nr:hypothetical protein [Candidatus Micrarchaeota archaeon]
MQDSREQPPPALPEDIVKMAKHKLSSDINPREIFWAMVSAYKEGEGFGELVKKYSGIREALVNIGCSVLHEPSKSYRVRIARTKLAKCLFSMIVKGRWGDVMERALSNLYERKKGPSLQMLMAFGDGFSENKEVVGPWLKSLLSEERPSEEVLGYVEGVGDRELVEYLRADLLNIARTEINEAQVLAMKSLEMLLPGDSEVGKMFIDMMDDWDMETKEVALKTLAKYSIPEAGKKAVSIYIYEPDEKFKIELEQIIEKNKEGAREEFGKAFLRARGQEAEALGALAKKVYGKKGAGKLIPENLPKEARREAEEAIG